MAEPFRGQLRKEDVRATEKDRVEMYKCFRPNDIILARVVIIFFTIFIVILTVEQDTNSKMVYLKYYCSSHWGMPIPMCCQQQKMN